MIAPEILVGAVAIVLGGVCLAAAIFNWPWSYELHKTRFLERLFGRTGARIFFALLGLGLIALGIAIALGFAPNASNRLAALSSTRFRLSIANAAHRNAP
jgi:hypothetical protein